jgi:hypothetical protein
MKGGLATEMASQALKTLLAEGPTNRVRESLTSRTAVALCPRLLESLLQPPALL